MKVKAIHTARIILGLSFVIFGLNGFFQFIPLPPPASPEAGAFLGALFQSGYFFPLLKATEIIAGVLLLGNILVPLALILLSPIVVQIFAFHAALDPGGMLLPTVFVVLMAFLGYVYRNSFAPLFALKIEPETNVSIRHASDFKEA